MEHFTSLQSNIYKLKIKQKTVSARTHAKSMHAYTHAHIYMKLDRS